MLRNMCLLLRTRNGAYRLLYDFVATLLNVQILLYCSETSFDDFGRLQLNSSLL